MRFDLRKVPMTTGRGAFLRLHLLVLGLLLAAACSGQGGAGCACMTPLPDGFPSNQRQVNAAQVRLSSSGLSFIEANGPAVAAGILGGSVLTFTLPPNCADGELCCEGGTPDICQIEINLAQLGGDPPRIQVDPANGTNVIDLTVRARVRTLQAIYAEADITVGTAKCRISANTEDGDVPSLTIKAKLALSQDPVAGTTMMNVVPGSVEVIDLEKDDIDIDSVNFGCGAAETFFKGKIVSTIRDLLADQIEGMLDDQLCKQCTGNGDCAPFGTCDTAAGVCMVTGAEPTRCLQVLGSTGRIEASALVGSLAPNATSSIDLYVVTGGYARTESDGLSLGALGGFVTADGAHDDCVPTVSAPSLAPISEAAELTGNTRPDGQPFHMGVSLHKQLLDRLGWTAFDSGALCMNLGTDSISLLNSATIGLLAPSVSALMHGDTNQVYLALRPQKPPVFTVGAGTFDESGAILDPILTVEFPALEIDFYARVDERFVRIFTLRTDLSLPVGLDGDDSGSLIPILGDLNGAFRNVKVVNSELLVETAAEIEVKFPQILGSLAPVLADALPPIALPSFFGLALGVDRGSFAPVGNKTGLGLFLTLGAAGKPTPRVDTQASVTSIFAPDAETLRARRVPTAEEHPVVTLALGATSAEGHRPLRPVEWQVRVDRGAWSDWSNDPARALRRDEFWLQGKHRIEVRAREVGQPLTTDPTPVVLEANVDTVPPNATARLLPDGTVRIEATDVVTAAEALEVRVDGELVTGVPAIVRLPEGATFAALDIEVIDEAGNVAKARAVDGDGGDESSGCGCSVGARQGGAGGSALVLLGVLGLGAVLVRRRRSARAAAAALALVGATHTLGACGDGDLSGPPDEEEEIGLQPGARGRYLDMTSEGERVVAVGYEDRFGDLVFGELKDGKLRLVPVDGVPADAPVVDEPSGYRGGKEAPGDDVGAYAQVVLRGGTALVAYQDVANGQLLFATEGQDGAFTRHIVDDAAGGGIAGLYNSMVLLSSGAPAVAYMVSAIPDGAGGFTAELRWAEATGPGPAGPADWQISVIAESVIPCTGLCSGSTPVCLVATNTCAAEDTSCGECASGFSCVAGSCQASQPDPGAASDLPYGLGQFASAALLPNGNPVVTFYDRGRGDAMLATRSGGLWSTSGLGAANVDDGQWTSAAVGPDGAVHVVFKDMQHGTLSYVKWTNGSVSTLETIDDGDRGDARSHPVGGGAHLFFDAGGQLTVLYQDEATSDLYIARKSGNGWSKSPLLDGEPGWGFYNTSAIVGDKTWWATFGYEKDKAIPGEIRIQTL